MSTYEQKQISHSQQAIEDLDTIWIHTLNKWSRKQADRY
jgi:toxin ParE1/3/4